MKTQNLSEAVVHYGKFMVALRYAHSDAIQSGDPFAEMAVFGLIGPSVELENKLKLVASAAGETADQPVNVELLKACRLALAFSLSSYASTPEEVERSLRAAIARAEKEGV